MNDAFITAVQPTDSYTALGCVVHVEKFLLSAHFCWGMVGRVRFVRFFEPKRLQSLLICMIEAFQRLSLTSSQYYTELSASQYSQHLAECPPIRNLDCLILSNFKSFKGKVYVGPLLDFTSIVGPNGAGKSNILDGLMFCLCNERSKVSFYDLREFIQRDGEETYNEMSQRKKFCEVEAQFVVEGGRKLSFRRRLFPNEKQEFAIDGEEYSQRVYENFLMRCNLNFMTANYAIWQGEVDKLLLKNPKELTGLFETVSGSAYFRNDQQELKKELTRIEEVVQGETAKLVKLRLQRKNIKKMHISKDSSAKSQADYERVVRRMLLAKMCMGEMEIKEAERELRELEKQERQRVKELNESKLRMQKEQADRIEIQNRMNQLMKEVAHSNTLLKTIEQSANIIDIQTHKDLQAEVLSLNKYTENLKNRRAELQHEAASLQSMDIDKEYLQLYGKWEKENEVMMKELAKKKNEYVYSEELLRTKRSILNEFHEKIKRAEKQGQEEERRRKELEANAEQLGKTIARMRVENGKLSQEFLNSKGRLEDHYQKLQALSEKMIELEGLLAENVENEKDKELVVKLGVVEGFKGLVEEWVRPAHKRYELCFQIMMGSVLKHLLSADEPASKQIAGKLREYGQVRTLIILSNVRERKEQIGRAAIGKDNQLAIDALEITKGPPNLEVFIKDYLNGKIICQDLEAGWALLAQNIRGVKEIYTLDGNVLRHDGVVSTYGSVDLIKNKYKYLNGAKSRNQVTNELTALQKEKTQIEEDVKVLKEKVNDEKIARHNMEVAKLQARREEIGVTINLIKKSGQGRKEVKIPRDLQGEIQELQRKVEGIRESMKVIEKEMLGSKIFTDFVKRNKIKDLGEFRSLEDLSSLEGKMKQKNKTAKDMEETDREIAKVRSSLAAKEERLQKLTARVNASMSLESKAQVMRNIKKGEEQLSTLRNRLTKMSTISVESLKFKSQLPQLDAKLALLKERHENMVKTELAQLGLEAAPEESEFKVLEEHMTVKLSRASKDNINEAYEELLKESKQLQAELQKHLLDISSFEEEGNSAERINREIQTIEGALKECNEQKVTVSDKLEIVKRDRKNLFMNFFLKLRPILIRTYQMLTENSDGVPGKVDLYLENEDFPCDDGIYYFPTPPTKRFVYDLDQLSGGEKSLASLALQYSIAIASKSPFLMLDEIDAFLDAANVLKFVKLVNESIRDKALQFILVTHKRSLFLSSKSLVGVAKSQANPFSKAYSLLLAAPDGEQDEEEP